VAQLFTTCTPLGSRLSEAEGIDPLLDIGFSDRGLGLQPDFKLLGPSQLRLQVKAVWISIIVLLKSD